MPLTVAKAVCVGADEDPPAFRAGLEVSVPPSRMKFTAEPVLRVQVLPAVMHRLAAPLGVKVKVATPLKVRLPRVWLFVAPLAPMKASVPWLNGKGRAAGQDVGRGRAGLREIGRQSAAGKDRAVGAGVGVRAGKGQHAVAEAWPAALEPLSPPL